MGPIAGALIAAAISAVFSIGATATQNKYNSPRAQRNRLRKAGLPLAYMYQGKVMGQSESPRLSIDPTLGTTQQRKLEQDQPLVDANVKNVEADTYIKDQEGTLKNIDLQYWMEQGKPNKYGVSVPNRTTYLKSLMAEKQTANFIRRQEGRIREIIKLAENELWAEGVQPEMKRQALAKIRQQIVNMVAQAGLMDQLKRIRGWEELIQSNFTESMEDKSDLAQGLVYLLMNLFSKSRL